MLVCDLTMSYMFNLYIKIHIVTQQLGFVISMSIAGVISNVYLAVMTIGFNNVGYCNTCGAAMVKSDVDMNCLHCSVKKVDSLIPAQAAIDLWGGEHNLDHSIDKRYGTAWYKQSIIPVILPFHHNTSYGIYHAQKDCHAIMYDKLSSLFVDDEHVIPVADETFMIHYHCCVLSKCWFKSSHGFVKFGLSDIISFSSTFAHIFPHGIIVINLAHKRSYYICVHTQRVDR